MIDTITRNPLHVSTHGDAVPILILPEAQLNKVTALLDGQGVPYWVDEETLSFDGAPEAAMITLSRREDAALVQRLLDSAPE